MQNDHRTEIRNLRALALCQNVSPSLFVRALDLRSDEGLTLETSAFQSLYGGQFTLSTPLINQIFVYRSPTDAAPQFPQKLIPYTIRLV